MGCVVEGVVVVAVHVWGKRGWLFSFKGFSPLPPKKNASSIFFFKTKSKQLNRYNADFFFTPFLFFEKFDKMWG